MALDRQTLDPAALDALVGKAVTELAAGYGGVMIDIGRKLGLYQAMAGAGPVTSQEVARAAGCAERYVREWLNAQAAGGYVALPPREPHLRADARAGLRARRRDEPGLHAADLGGGRRRLGRRGEDHRGLPHRQGRELGRARRPAPLRRRRLLPQRLPREPRRRMAAGARRRGREARGGRARRRHRLRPRPFDAADGRGLPEVAVLRLRHARGLDRGGAGARPRGGPRGPGELRPGRRQGSRCRGRSTSSASSTACTTSAIRSRRRAGRARRWPRTAR